MIFKLPEIGRFKNNWDVTFLTKFETAHKNGSTMEVIGEFSKFAAINEKNIPENILILFLRKLEEKFEVDDIHIRKTIDEYKKLLAPEDDERIDDPEIKENSFHQSIKYIRKNYLNLYVNSLTNEIMYIYNESVRNLDIETLFTELAFEGINIQPKKIFSYFYSKKYTRHENPVRNLLESTDYKTGTDPDFIAEVLSFLKFPAFGKMNFNVQKFYRTMFEKWLVRCIENAIDDKSLPNKQMLILKGKQNSRKTSLLRWIYSPFKNYATENIEINSKEVRTKKAITTNMFILNDEFDRMSNKELQQFKIITTENFVKYRPNQQYTEKIMKRRANFMSSTNEEKFLTDRSGNVRYIILEIENSHTNPISADLLNNTDLALRMWSQAYALYKEETPFYDSQITGDELIKLDNLNKKYYTYRNLNDAIQYLYPKPEDDNDCEYMNASELLDHMRQNPNFPKNLMAGKTHISIGRILSKLYYERHATRQGKNQIYRWKIKMLK